MEAAIVISIIKLLLEKGIPMTIDILSAWKKEDPTLSDIDKLHDIVKRPESYFE